MVSRSVERKLAPFTKPDFSGIVTGDEAGIYQKDPEISGNQVKVFVRSKCATKVHPQPKVRKADGGHV